MGSGHATRATLQKLGPALYFENIKGMDYPMVAGMLAEDSRFLSRWGWGKLGYI